MKLRTMHMQNLLEKVKAEALPLVIIGGVERLRMLYPEFAALYVTYGKCLDMRHRLETLPSNTVVLITTRHYKRDFEQLKDLDNDCYILYYAERGAYIADYQLPSIKGRKRKIPKKLHYIWFGGQPMPARYQTYIDGWKKQHPDWEIVRWDESNYDVGKHPFIRAAYDKQQWAFASDWARLDLLYTHGGVYLDGDMEVFKPLDRFLYDDMFFGIVEHVDCMVYQFQAMGAKKGCPLVKTLLHMYDGLVTQVEDGSFSFLALEAEVVPKIMETYGFESANTMQLVNGVRLYPQDVLTPSDWACMFHAYSHRTHAIHHSGGAWFDQPNQTFHSQLRDRSGYDFLIKNICVDHT